MQKVRRTKQQELVLEGELHFPLTLLDSETFREWRQACARPSGVEASHRGGMVTIETDLDWSMHYSDRSGPDHEPPPEWKEAPCFCVDGLFYVPCSAFELEGFREWVHSDWFPEKVNPVGRYDYRLLQRKPKSQ